MSPMSLLWDLGPHAAYIWASYAVVTLGLAVTGQFRSQQENVDEDICALGSGPHRVEVDLMQPLDAQARPAR